MATASKPPSFSLRTLEPRDLPRAYALTLGDGWSHGPEDWRFFSSTGTGIVAERDGHVLGTILYWLYGSSAASIGMLIVDGTQQRQGIGRALMDACFERLRGRTIYLIATSVGVPLYEKLGFVRTGSVTIWKGLVGEQASRIPAVEGLRIATAVEQGKIIRLLNQACGLDRTELLQAIFDMPETEVAVLEQDGVIKGVSVYKKCLDGYWIGPVAANDQEAAQALTLFWLRRYPGRLTRIDSTDAKDGDFIAQYGLKRLDIECPTMRRGEASPAADSRMGYYAILAQATG